MQKRFIELDLLRGLAVVGMIIYHLFYVMNFYGVFEQEMREGRWQILRIIVQFLFIGLVGISMQISWQKSSKSRAKFYKKHWRRAVIMFALGMLITLVTWFVIGEGYVRFGILHFIGVAILCASFVVGHKFLLLLLAIVSFWIFWWTKDIHSSSIILHALGTELTGTYSIDYFPISKWLPLVFVSMFFGEVFYTDLDLAVKRFRFLRKLKLNTIYFLGRHSLIIYLIHVPLIILILLVLGVLPFSAIQKG